MKLKLPTVEDTDHINYRVPRSVRVELDQLAQQCKAAKLDFTAALVLGLRETAKAIREELEKQARKRGAKSGANMAPDTSTNGAGE
jgi:predicted TIM-barrel fold metal-dependent hydrolase